jgi:hypothetical protein
MVVERPLFPRGIRFTSIPELRVLLIKRKVKSTAGMCAILASISEYSLEWWGVLENQVLVQTRKARILFFVTASGVVVVEYFPNVVWCFEDMIYLRGITETKDLLSLRQLLIRHLPYRTDYSLIYHGQDPEMYVKAVHG